MYKTSYTIAFWKVALPKNNKKNLYSISGYNPYIWNFWICLFIFLHPMTVGMPQPNDLIRTATELIASNVDYDPCFPRMNIAKGDLFKYHVNSALWDIAMAQ
jgi:hypothetical protein